MIIEGYGIKLMRLQDTDIELVRKWRNSETVNQFMEYREIISSTQQKKWFESIDNVNNNYFIIIVDEKKIGLIYGADIDWNKKVTGNGGIFIWEATYWETIVPLSASLLLTDTSLLLDLKETHVKILKDNKKAIAFNKTLGYILCDGQEEVWNQKYTLTMNNYIPAQEKLRKRFFSQFSYTTTLTFDKENPIDTFFLDIVNIASSPLKSQYRIVVK